jgi:hypothetical protein
MERTGWSLKEHRMTDRSVCAAAMASRYFLMAQPPLVCRVCCSTRHTVARRSFWPVGAVYDRAYSINSTNNRAVIDRAYNGRFKRSARWATTPARRGINSRFC